MVELANSRESNAQKKVSTSKIMFCLYSIDHSICRKNISRIFWLYCAIHIFIYLHRIKYPLSSKTHTAWTWKYSVQFQMRSEIQLLLLIFWLSIDRFTIASWSMWNGTKQWKSISEKKSNQCKRKQSS